MARRAAAADATKHTHFKEREAASANTIAAP